jgi:hypothetical protein
MVRHSDEETLNVQSNFANDVNNALQPGSRCAGQQSLLQCQEISNAGNVFY